MTDSTHLLTVAIAFPVVRLPRIDYNRVLYGYGRRNRDSRERGVTFVMFRGANRTKKLNQIKVTADDNTPPRGYAAFGSDTIDVFHVRAIFTI